MGSTNGGERSRRSTLDGESYARYLIECVNRARQRLWLKVPWIGPLQGHPAALLEALRACAERGVDTRVLLRPEASNTAALQALAVADVPLRTVRYLHEKEMLIDDGLVVFSANFTPTELGRNSNHTYEITDKSDIEAAEASFHVQWLLDEAISAAGEETWTKADQVIPSQLQSLLGRTDLNPLQAKALPIVFGSEAGLLVTAPTGSGKTTIGEAAVLKAIRLQRRKAVYITPSRALTRELHGTFERWQAAGIRVGILSGDVDTDMDAVERCDLWVSTTEKFESAFRKSSLADAIAEVGCVVVDEIHFLGDQTRGPLLEALLARLRLLAARTRLVGLSATVANDQQLADWLGAQLVQSTWRPVQLTLQVLGYPATGKWLDDEEAKDDLTRPIVQDITNTNGKVVVFCGSKPKAKRVAADLASVPSDGDDEQVAADALAAGVGLHYRGLSSLKETERRFRQREIPVLVATSGLAQGVNLPARAVVIRDTELGKEPMSTGDALQMAGRAGRVGHEDAGFAFLLAPDDLVASWRTRLVEGHAVHSHLADGLVDHVLAEILLGRIRSARTLRDWFAGTFAAYEGGLTERDAGTVLDGAIGVLTKARFVTVADDGDSLACTELGSLTSRFLIDATSAAAILELLPGADPADADEAENRLLVALAVAGRAFRGAYAPAAAVSVGMALLPLSMTHDLGPAPEAGSVKTLLAAHIALEDPARLRKPGRIAEVSASELNDMADDLARHLGWLSALGMAAPLGWVPAVANDLSGRIRWRALQPPRGSGRVLRLLMRQIPTDQHRRELPRQFRRLSGRADGAEAAASARDGASSQPLVGLHVSTVAGEEHLRLDLRVDDSASLPLKVVALARSSAAVAAANAERWDGAPISVPIPVGTADDGSVALDVLAYAKNDWDWFGEVVAVFTAKADPVAELNRLIEKIPETALALPKRPRIFGRTSWIERSAASVLKTPPQELEAVARVVGGVGSEHARAWRLAVGLWEAVHSVRPGDELVTPGAALRAGGCGPSSWALCYSSTALAVGLSAGVVRQLSDDKLIAIVEVDGDWRLVPSERGRTPTSTTAMIPPTAIGQLRVLDEARPEPPPPPPQPGWGFLTEFRTPGPALPASARRQGTSEQPLKPPPHMPRVPAALDPLGSQDGEWDISDEELLDPDHADAGPMVATIDRKPFTAPTTVTEATRITIAEREPGLFDRYPRAYSRWSQEEETHLINLYRSGLSVEAIANLHRRQPSAIESRIEKLQL